MFQHTKASPGWKILGLALTDSTVTVKVGRTAREITSALVQTLSRTDDPTVLVVGSEGEGLHPSVGTACAAVHRKHEHRRKSNATFC